MAMIMSRAAAAAPCSTLQRVHRVGRARGVTPVAVFKGLGALIPSKPSKASTTSGKKPVVSKPVVSKNKVAKPLEPFTDNANAFKLGFTKANELFVGRIAMLGFASSLIGEILTGKGALAQLGYEIGVPTFEVDWIIGFLISFNLIAALLPTSQTFIPEEQEGLQDRPAGPFQDPSITIFEPQKFFATSQFGFSKANELFVGRMAQLGFAASLIGEIASGKGPLAQFGFETGIPIQDTEFGLLVFITFFLFAAINEGSGKFVSEDKA